MCGIYTHMKINILIDIFLAYLIIITFHVVMVHCFSGAGIDAKIVKIIVVMTLEMSFSVVLLKRLTQIEIFYSMSIDCY